MANITAQDVAALRAKTGLGMMDCKKALVEAEGDQEKAIKILREKGLATAAKKESRIAAEGVVAIKTIGSISAIIEVNTETDFVAKNASFLEFVDGLLETIIAKKPADVAALEGCTFASSAMTVSAALTDKIAVIGEKISIRRFQIVEGTVSTYVHGRVNPAVAAGGTGVIVKFEGSGSYTCNVYGYDYVGSGETTGASNLEFDGYTGSISGNIGGFDKITFAGNVDATLATVENTDWEFDLTNRSAANNGFAMLNWADGEMSGNSVALRLASDASASNSISSAPRVRTGR